MRSLTPAPIAAWTALSPQVSAAALFDGTLYAGAVSQSGPWLYRAEAGALVDAGFTAPAYTVACRGLLAEGAYLYALLAVAETAPHTIDQQTRSLVYRFDGADWTLAADGAGALFGLALRDGTLYSIGTGLDVEGLPATGLFSWTRYAWRLVGSHAQPQRLRRQGGNLLVESYSGGALHLDVYAVDALPQGQAAPAGYVPNTAVIWGGALWYLTQATNGDRLYLHHGGLLGGGDYDVASWNVTKGYYWNMTAWGGGLVLLGGIYQVGGFTPVYATVAAGRLTLAQPLPYTPNQFEGGVLLGRNEPYPITVGMGVAPNAYWSSWGVAPETRTADTGEAGGRLVLDRAAVIVGGARLEGFGLEWGDNSGDTTVRLETFGLEWRPLPGVPLARLVSFGLQWADDSGDTTARLEGFGFAYGDGTGSNRARLTRFGLDWQAALPLQARLTGFGLQWGDGSAGETARLESFGLQWRDRSGTVNARLETFGLEWQIWRVNPPAHFARLTRAGLQWADAPGPPGAGESVLYLVATIPEGMTRCRIVTDQTPEDMAATRALIRLDGEDLDPDAWGSYQPVRIGSNLTLDQTGTELRVALIGSGTVPSAYIQFEE